MQTDLPNSDIQLLRNVTRDYARYARNAAGLGNVVGGALALLMYAAGLVWSLGTAERFVLALLPLAWVLFKELLRRTYYQRHGRVTEPLSRQERNWHVALTVLTALMALGILVAFGNNVRSGRVEDALWGGAGYTAFVAALPLLVWFFMWTTEEYLVGVLLVCQAAVLLAGGHYPLRWEYFFFPLFALFAVVAGVRQHRHYLELERRLRSLRGRD